MIRVTLYSRPDCHLCEEVELELETLQAMFPHKLAVVDIDTSPDLQKAYGLEVPVVEVGPYRLKAPISRQELQMTLGAAADRERHIKTLDEAAVSGGLSQVWTKADSFAYWFARHYLAVLNLFVLIYVGLPFLAPVLMKAGVEGPANLIYRGYGMVCHQLAFRSFYLFGEQYAYPRAAAGAEGLVPYGQATGLSEGSDSDDLWTARTFVGNEALGYKVALCERDVGIYAAILLFGVLFALTGRNWPSIPWYLWILVGIVPVGLDGVSQLLSQPPFNFFPYRESTPFLRTLTGVLFGFMTAWFGYPMVEETMAESRELLGSKLKRVQRAREQKA